MSPSTTSSDDNAQGRTVPDRRHSISRAANKADLMEEIGPSIFEYHTKRETGLISANEECRWGYEDPRRRHEALTRYNNKFVAQYFFKVDWDKGFAGRGVDFRYGDYHLEGPTGETLEYVADAEVPTLLEARRLWRMVDKGDDEGVDPHYGGPPIDWDENTSWSDDEDVGPLGQTEVDHEVRPVTESQQHAQVDASGEKIENLQDIAAQAFLVPGDNSLGPFYGTRQEAEIGSSGEMRHVLRQIVDESSQTPDGYQATTNVPASFELSPESTKRLGKKRAWAALCGDGDESSDEGSDDEGNRGPKRLRTWRAKEADTLGEVNDIIGDNLGEDSRTEASSCIWQADEKYTLGEVGKGKPMSSNPEGMKRWRSIPLGGLDEDNSSDGEWQPQLKRQCVRFGQPMQPWRMVGQRSHTSENSMADNSSNDVVSETDASSINSGLSNFQSDQALEPVKTRARPTFYGISVQTNDTTKKLEWVPDNNEARRYRSFAEEEEEDLRSWVQDYGMQENWSEIAWCLHRSEDDCQTRYRRIVMARNRRAGRDLEAGLPGWVDHELEVTPEEIAQLVAEDLAKREAVRKGEGRSRMRRQDEPKIDEELDMKRGPEKGAGWKANAELRLTEEEENNGEEPESKSERRVTVKTED